jgi:allantoinase
LYPRSAAWGGISSIQLGLPVVWTQAAERGYNLTDVVRWMAERPAQLAGLAGKGAIAEGGAADLIAFAPDQEFVVDADRLLTRHKLTPYAGKRLRGVVRRTWLAGVEISADQRAGKLLRAPVNHDHGRSSVHTTEDRPRS